jgi:prepilin-type N-terminal cleavage/methylation domain-containing protein/prepilin-type processing-associated H-X9-DG protein
MGKNATPCRVFRLSLIPISKKVIMRSSLSSSRRGFTLIELLVVIAIISILASMLFPAFSRARESARKVVCASNLKQIGLGIYMYKQDYDEMFPIGHPCWASYPTPPTAGEYLLNVVDPYIKSTQVWQCPSWKGVSLAYNGSYNFITDEDGIGNNVIGVPDNADPLAPPIKMPRSDAALSQPSLYPLLFCGTAPQQTDPSQLVIHSSYKDAQWKDGSVGGTNILFADGHVKYLTFSYGKWDDIYHTMP